MNTLFIKAIRDLMAKKVQSLIIVVALSLGVIGVGAIFNVYTILKREMQKNYDMTNPPHFVINLDSVPSGLGEQLQELKSSYDWEYRGIINGRVLSGDGTWKSLILEVVPDFTSRNINRFFEMPGSTVQQELSPAIGAVFVEKAAMPVAKKRIGEKLTIIIPGAAKKELPITGMYHAPSLAPAWMENWVYGFISEQTAFELTGKSGLNRVLFRSRQLIQTNAQAQNEADAMKVWFSKKGIKVTSVTVPVPGAHPHAGQMNSFLYMMQVFGLIAFLLAATLVGNIFGSLLARQKREIGIMKAIGGTTGQILSINLLQMVLMSIVAFLIAIPAGQFFAHTYSTFTANILNFKIYDATIPLWGYALQLVIGLGIPLLMVILQTRGSLKLTVCEVLADYGVRSVEKNMLSVRFPLKPGITPLVLSLRNAFRKRYRMVLLLISLSAGGILFMMSQNISQSIGVTVNNMFLHCQYDAAFTLSNSSGADIEQFFSGRKEINLYETWSTSKGMRNGKEVDVYALPAHTAMMDFTVDKESAVVTHAFAGFYKKSIGEMLEIETPSGVIKRKISSIVTIFDPPAVYIAQESLSGNEESFNPFITVSYKNSNSIAKLNSNHLQKLVAQIRGTGREKETGSDVSDLTTTIENDLNNQTAVVMNSQNKQEQKDSMIAHMKLIASFLIMMSVLSLFVGALTIISSVSLSIVERRREIGILRAFGTQSASIIRLFLFENVFIGVVAFVLAAIVSYPISIFAGTVFGMIFLKIPLNPAVSHSGLGLWLLISLLLTTIFSYFPSVNAAECELPSLLNYE